jgi:hypothetical protein
LQRWATYDANARLPLEASGFHPPAGAAIRALQRRYKDQPDREPAERIASWVSANREGKHASTTYAYAPA